MVYGFFWITEKTASFLIKCIPYHYMIKFIIISIAENVVRSRIEFITPSNAPYSCGYFYHPKFVGASRSYDQVFE